MFSEADEGLSNKDHALVASFVEKTAGIQLPPTKKYLIEGRLSKRCRALGFKHLHEYLNFALNDKNGNDERIQIIEALTTHKTEFFRENEHFKLIEQKVIPEYVSSGALGVKRPMRFWSAGCSSGEEAYTLAMLLTDAQKKYPGFNFDISASDISQRILKKAVNGVYAHDTIEPVPIQMRRDYLMRRNNDKNIVKVAPEIRRKVQFFQFNLLRDQFKFRDQFDIIFCRNVMIYFNQEDRTQLIQKFINALKPKGLLFIGHSERINDHDSVLEAVIPNVYQKP